MQSPARKQLRGAANLYLLTYIYTYRAIEFSTETGIGDRCMTKSDELFNGSAVDAVVARGGALRDNEFERKFFERCVLLTYLVTSEKEK